jgi:hypothetical protein
MHSSAERLCSVNNSAQIPNLSLSSAESSLSGFLQAPFTSSLLYPNNFIGSLFSKILYLFSSLDVNNKISHQYNEQVKL